MLRPTPVVAVAQSSRNPWRDTPRVDRSEPTRALAFVGLVTTGPDPLVHQAIDLAVLRVDARTLHELAEHTTLVVPERLQDARAEALALAGFSKAAWSQATPLADALRAVRPLLEGALLAGYHVGRDWAFLEASFRRAGVMPPDVGDDRFDVASLAWPLASGGVVPSTSLDVVSAHLGLARPRPLRALADARCARDIARHLATAVTLGRRMSVLSAEPRRAVEVFLTRLEHRAKAFGPWHVDDRDVSPDNEALAALDAAFAGLARDERAKARHRRVYVCHPAGHPEDGHASVRGICQRLLDGGVLPVAPQLDIPALLGARTEGAEALRRRLELLATCDEVRVFGDVVTEDMEQELREARALGLSVTFVREVFA